METPLLKLRVAALASVLAWTGIVPAAAAPAFMPYAPAMQSGVVQVVDSVIVRRDNRRRERDGDTRRHRRENREHARHHDDGVRSYAPRATRKHAYDADGNYRTYDGDGWDDDGHWRGRNRGRDWRRWNGWDSRGDWNAGGDWNDWDRNGWHDWDHKKAPRLYRRQSYSFQGTVPSPELRDILTAVPD